MSITDQYIDTRNRIFQTIGINPISKQIEIDGPIKNVHFLEIGSGEPLILIHGGLSHSGEWINIMEPLSKKYHLYVIDRPGHGLSDMLDYRGVDYQNSAAKFIKSFMDALGLRQANLLGCSMGGYFAVSFALQYPDRVEKLSLMGAPAGMNRWIPPMLRILGIPGLNRFILGKLAKPSLKSAKSIHRQLLVANINNISEDMLNLTWMNQSLPGALISHTTMLENVLDLKGWRKKLLLTDQISNLKMPVHFIWGEKDAFENPDSGREKAKKIKVHSFEIIANAGHLPWVDQPEECVESLFKFLNT
ncbi:MAG: alpha/beta hydrolase [Saprospiraceae bacterium]|nr:alpha/beta hydrolase [Saprospiraceae bacterium]